MSTLTKEQLQKALLLQRLQADQVGGLSSGYAAHGLEDHQCPGGITENLALGITGAAIAAVAVFLYREIRLAQAAGGGRRQTRDLDHVVNGNEINHVAMVMDVVDRDPPCTPP